MVRTQEPTGDALEVPDEVIDAMADNSEAHILLYSAFWVVYIVSIY